MSDSISDEQVLDEPALRTFTLQAFDVGNDGEEDVELIVTVPEVPSILRHTSLALLYGLAILSLDQDGTLQRRMDELLEAGPISEIDACNRINLLILKEENDLVI